MKPAPSHRIRWRASALGIRAVVVGVAAVVVAALAPIAPATASVLSGKADSSLVAAAQAAPGLPLGVIVRKAAPQSEAAEAMVRRLGGTVTHELPIIHGFSAEIPGEAVDAVARSSAVARIWSDAHIHMLTVDMRQYMARIPNNFWYPELHVGQVQSRGYDGTGVGVALLDTGVHPTPDLGSRLVYSASFAPDVDVYDHYGHGTHLAGIIAGNGAMSNGAYQGVAPGANVISVKVAEPDGSTDVSVVIDGLQWIYSNAARYKIKVVNLSFGTDGVQSYLLDPLDYAVEQVWSAGITIVVSAGNRGPNAGTITKPGDDPFVVTVGAVDTGSTTQTTDDTVASFSSQGPTQDGLAKPDLVAPGISIVSDRDPGSWLDAQYPAARVGDNYFKGSGTSQASAMVSGVVALMYQANPNLSPNVVKSVLTYTAQPLVGQQGSGAGLLDAAAAVRAAALNPNIFLHPANVGVAPSTGMGSLEGSRGSYHVYTDLDGDGASDDMVTGDIGFSGTSWGGTSWGGDNWG